MLVGMKNAVELLPHIHEKFDFAINLACFEFDECDGYSDTFIAAGKPVFNVEFEAKLDHCDEAETLHFDSIVKVGRDGNAVF